MIDIRILESFDARDWAKVWAQTIQLHPNIPWDEGTMIAWFANALMRGYDEGQRQACGGLNSAKVNREEPGER